MRISFSKPTLTVQRLELEGGKRPAREVGELAVAITHRVVKKDLGRQSLGKRRKGETLR